MSKSVENDYKVGILTLNGYWNYGNVLQNLGLQIFLEEFGVSPETIWYTGNNDSSNVVSKIWYRLKTGDFVKSIRGRVFPKGRYERIQMDKRKRRFKSFCDRYISYSAYSITRSTIDDEVLQRHLNDTYAAAFVGSDQVWGLEDGKFPRAFFLDFMAPQKRNAFAASFGFSQIPDNHFTSSYEEGIRGLNRISVREIDGAEIVRSLTGREATVLLDPVFLVSRDVWLEVAAESLLAVNNHFLLTYFLGNVTDEWQRIVRKIAINFHLHVINLNSIKDPEYYSAGPQDFIRLFESADFIVTDSFHGAAFSVILKKQFIVLDRIDGMVRMSSRITTLLNRMGLTDRFIHVGEKVNEFNFPAIDFSTSETEIANNICDAKAFVNNALS